MSISYNDITYIQNGQAITAANLNAPSQGLEARTVEIKRDSDQSRFDKVHTIDSEVVLVSSNSAQSSITVRSQLKEDGTADANLIKYYLPELNNLHFSIYSKYVHGGRYIIPGANIGALYSDSINSTNQVLSTALSVPGDGIYAKIPLRHTGQEENLNNYPDLVYPKTKDQSVGDSYLTLHTATPTQTPEVVKLPELVFLDVLSTSAGENVATFLSRLTTQYSVEIDSATVDSEGALTILDPNGNALALKIEGLKEGSECVVSHLNERSDGEPGLVIRFTRASSPIYIEHDQRVAITGLSTALFLNNVQQGISSLTPFSQGSYSGYFVLPKMLDPDYSYVPLIRLTENSLLVADKVIPLTARTLSNGVLINEYGDPIYGVPPELAQEGSAEYEIDILGSNRVNLAYKRSYNIELGEHATNGTLVDTTTATSALPDVVYLKGVLSNSDRVAIRRASILVTQSFLSNVLPSLTQWEVTVSLTADGNTISETVDSIDSLQIGDIIEFSFDSQLTIAAPVASLQLGVVARANSTYFTLTGAVAGTIELQVI